MVLGLALVLALLFGVASMALAGTGVGSVFNLGVKNTVGAVTQLVSSEGAGPNGPMLRIDNNGAGTALDLRVGSPTTPPAFKTVPPMKVDSGARVANLNADLLDGKEMSNIEPLTASVGGFSGNIQGAAEGAVSASKIRTGVFVVQFNRSVSGCARVASLGRETSSFEDPDQEADPEIINVPRGQASPFNVTNIANPDRKIGVLTTDSAGARADLSFQLAVFC
jgi:hypothetical protein